MVTFHLMVPVAESTASNTPVVAWKYTVLSSGDSAGVSAVPPRPLQQVRRTAHRMVPLVLYRL